MTYEHIIWEVRDGIVTVTFNRPKALNALNAALLQEFSLALDQVAENEDLRVVVLTGAGNKAFVAGADISELATFNPLEARHFSTLGHRVIGKLQQLAVPVIAAVNGYALGGGSEIALACDFIYAADNARFGLPEITLGIIPGFGGTQRLPRLVGKNIAKEMIFTGKMITAEEARQVGMVNRVFSVRRPHAGNPEDRRDHGGHGKGRLEGREKGRQRRFRHGPCQRVRHGDRRIRPLHGQRRRQRGHDGFSGKTKGGLQGAPQPVNARDPSKSFLGIP